MKIFDGLFILNDATLRSQKFGRKFYGFCHF